MTSSDANPTGAHSHQEGAPAGHPAPGHQSDHHAPTANDPVVDDTTGVANMVEEGAPLEPQDLADVESTETTGTDATGALEAKVAELTNDLQRLQAEFLNYKRRVERDRVQTVENATFKALAGVVEVLDTIDRAREAGPLDDGLQAVATQLETAMATQGLTMFAEPGEVFDPTLHEALVHQGEAEGVEVPTISAVVKSGIRIGDRVVRAAQVLVHGPTA